MRELIKVVEDMIVVVPQVEGDFLAPLNDLKSSIEYSPPQAYKATIIEQLRGIKRESWAEIEEPNGWTYHTNIGLLVHNAANEIEALQSAQKPPNKPNQRELLSLHFFGLLGVAKAILYQRLGRTP
ncbi:MAG: hypothetical protein GY797_27160 [Deltaproteobacteria bacterium]|nr:hypothetical protein [Deltaproteobacteria bacterium]